MAVELPEGFELDQPQQQNSMGLPEGFELDQAPQQRQPSISRGEAAFTTMTNPLGFGDEIKAGLSAMTAKIFGGQATKGIDIGDLYKEARDIERDKLARARQEYPVQSFAGQMFSDVGVAGKALKATGLTGQGFGTAIKGGALLGGASALGETQDITNIPQTAKDVGLGVGLGGLTGGAVQKLAPAAISGAGALSQLPKKAIQKMAGITPKSQETLKAFEDAGITPTLANITQGNTSKTFQNLLGNFPGSRGVIEKATQNQVDDITKQIAGITKSEGGTIQEAGKKIQQGAQNLKQGLENRIEQNYNQLDKFIPDKNAKIATSNLDELMNDAQIQDVAAVGAGDTARVISRYQQIKEGLNYPRLKTFRSTIGAKLQSPTLLGDERAALKRIYGALSEDMKVAVQANGGEKALQSFTKANKAFSRYQDVIENKINPIIEAKTPEAVYSMAMSGTKQGGSNIKGIMRTLDPEQQDFVRGTIARRMGLANAGEQDATGEVFSPNKFLTEWNKLSPEAKNNIYTKEQVNAVNNLNKAISAIKDTSKARQSSNNLPYAAWIGLGSLSMANLPAGAATVAGANITAKMMTNPRFINWLASSAKVKPTQIPAHLSQLSAIAAANPDIREEVLDYLQSITSDAQAADFPPKESSQKKQLTVEEKRELIRERYKREVPWYTPTEAELTRFSEGYNPTDEESVQFLNK